MNRAPLNLMISPTEHARDKAVDFRLNERVADAGLTEASHNGKAFDFRWNVPVGSEEMSMAGRRELCPGAADDVFAGDKHHVGGGRGVWYGCGFPGGLFWFD